MSWSSFARSAIPTLSDREKWVATCVPALCSLLPHVCSLSSKPKDGAALVGWVFACPSIHAGQCPADMHAGQPDLGVLSLWLSSQRSLDYLKMTAETLKAPYCLLTYGWMDILPCMWGKAVWSFQLPTIWNLEIFHIPTKLTSLISPKS